MIKLVCVLVFFTSSGDKVVYSDAVGYTEHWNERSLVLNFDKWATSKGIKLEPVLQRVQSNNCFLLEHKEIGIHNTMQDFYESKKGGLN